MLRAPAALLPVLCDLVLVLQAGVHALQVLVRAPQPVRLLGALLGLHQLQPQPLRLLILLEAPALKLPPRALRLLLLVPVQLPHVVNLILKLLGGLLLAAYFDLQSCHLSFL